MEVHRDAHTSQTARNIPPGRVQNHTVIVEKHYHNYYGPRYDYYRTQPPVYVGLGYSSLFWYAMMDWEIERQARWYYNHEQQFINGELNRDLWSERMKNDRLRAEVERLRAQKAAQDPNYVDPEFKEHPEAMLDSEFVKAAHQEESETSSSAAWTVVSWALAILVVTLVVWVIFFKIKWGNN